MEELPSFDFDDSDAEQATAKTKRQPPANIPQRPAKKEKKKQPTYEQVYSDDEITWLETQHGEFLKRASTATKSVFDGSNITRDAKIKGSLIGLAYGDVLGCPIEGYRWWNIVASYGPEEGLAFAKRKSGQIMPETDEDYLILNQTYLKPPITYNFERLRAVGKFTAIRKLRPFGIHSDDTQQALALIGLVMTSFQANRNVPLADDWARWLTRGHLTKAWRGIGRNFSTAVGRLVDGQKAEAAANFSTGIGAIMRIGPMGALYLNKDINDLADAVFETTLVTHKSICPAAMAFAIALTVRHFIRGDCISNIIAELPDQIEAQENRFIAKETAENRWEMKKSVATDSHTVSTLLRNVLKKVSEINANKSISVHERLWAMRAIVSQEAKLYAETSKAIADDDEEEEEEDKSSKKAKIQAFHPNQNLFSLGGIHALVVALAEGLVDPHETIMGVVKLGYDADTVGAICGSMLGARFGTSWIETKYIFDYDRLDKVADAIVSLNQDESYVVLGESRAEFMKEESMLTALESKCKKFYKDKNAPHNAGANIN